MLHNNLVSRHDHAIADTGSSGHYINANTPCKQIQHTTTGPTVMLPDGTQIDPTHEAKLALPTDSFSDESIQAYVFPQIKKHFYQLVSYVMIIK